MKHLALIVLLLLCAPILRADEPAPTREQLAAQLQADTAKIEILKNQAIPANNAEAQQENYFQTAGAYEARAKTYEKLEDWKAAAVDWYLLDFMRSKLSPTKYAAVSNMEAFIRTKQASNQIKAGDWEGADRSMQDARRGKGWDARSVFISFTSALVNLFFNRPDAALADALNAKALDAQKDKVSSKVYTAISLAYYQKGDLENARANWDEVLKMVPDFADVKPFSEDGARLNAAIAQNPNDPKA